MENLSQTPGRRTQEKGQQQGQTHPQHQAGEDPGRAGKQAGEQGKAQAQQQGYRDIPSDILIALADLYGTSTDYILGRTDDPRFSGAKGK